VNLTNYKGLSAFMSPDTRGRVISAGERRAILQFRSACWCISFDHDQAFPAKNAGAVSIPTLERLSPFVAFTWRYWTADWFGAVPDLPQH